jgi:hypothetical protein
MWTSAARPGPSRLYRRDDNNDYSVQTYFAGGRWRLYGYNGDTAHADTHVGYADSAGALVGLGKGTVVASASPNPGEYPMFAFAGFGLFAFPHNLGTTPSTVVVCNGDGNSYGANNVFAVYATDASNITVKVIGWSSGNLRCNWVAFL